VALVAALGVARGVGRGVAARPAPPVVPHPAPEVAPSSSPTPVDLEALRDVFRFGRAPRPERRDVEAVPPPAAGAATPGPSPGPRLVGLVRRAGRLVAALAIDGDVVLAGPGETKGGVTILSVGEDLVRIRHADGREEDLGLP
jgi:hypothetical protein